MSIELGYLTWVAALTAVMWVPYILNRIMVQGLVDTVGYPQDPAPLSPWAARMKAAHGNAVENLVVFAALVLIADAAGVTSAATVTACQGYLWARVTHFLAYSARIPWLRTVAFLIGFGCQATLAWEILA
ncbi:MAG: MAPEG family protein [Woeseiaceae bacterium]